MRLVKFFNCKENETEQLETKINTWIEQSSANLISVTGNIAPQSQVAFPNKSPDPSDVLIVVVYEPSSVEV